MIYDHKDELCVNTYYIILFQTQYESCSQGGFSGEVRKLKCPLSCAQCYPHIRCFSVPERRKRQAPFKRLADEISVGVETVQTLPINESEKSYVLGLEYAETAQGWIMEGDIFNCSK